jgi:hypothetical protein
MQEYDYKQLINKVFDKYLIQYHNNKIDIRLLWDAMKVDLLHLKINIYFLKNGLIQWQCSGIFFVNDIIDKNGKITQEFILRKLKNKSKSTFIASHNNLMSILLLWYCIKYLSMTLFINCL